MKQWQTYEEVATYLLDRFAHEFGLDRVEGKQSLAGGRSGTSWEIDAKGVREVDGAVVIVECRQYRNARQSQGKLGELAYRIADTGADGGILVSPLGFQEGAKRVAAAECIHEVVLDADSTSLDFVMRFLSTLMVGGSDAVNISQEIGVQRDRPGEE